MNWLLTSLLSLRLDLVTGIALITLFFMMLQTEHERCDRVRAGWREVRRATFAATSALQRAKKEEGQPNEATYTDSAILSLQELYSAVLLNGKGTLRKTYTRALDERLQTKDRNGLLPVFNALDNQIKKQFDSWRLRIL